MAEDFQVDEVLDIPLRRGRAPVAVGGEARPEHRRSGAPDAKAAGVPLRMSAMPGSRIARR
jgi:hypothetical protein